MASLVLREPDDPGIEDKCGGCSGGGCNDCGDTGKVRG